MRHRTRVALVAVIAFVALAPLPAAAQSADPAGAFRTPWGDPDVQGIWANNSATPLERPDAFAGKAVLTDEELAQLERRAAEVLDGDDAFFGDDFITAALADDKQFRSFDTDTGNYNQFWLVDRQIENRTSLIVDPPTGKLPAMTADGEQRAVADVERLFGGRVPAGPADLSLPVRCITFGIPNLFAGYNSNVQILQTPDHIVMWHELMHDARVISLDGGPYPSEDIRQWHGVSRGHWEGDTLVVETRNYAADTRLTIPGSAAGGAHLRVVERVRRVDADTLQWDVTFEDPVTWTEPWTARMFVQQTEGPIFEYACHEGNYGMTGILAGARVEETGGAGR